VVDVREELDKRLAELGEFIKAQREMGQISMRRLADLSGVSNPYLSQIERGLRRPSADILSQIAAALQISAETLYERAGHPARRRARRHRQRPEVEAGAAPGAAQRLRELPDGQRLASNALCNGWPSSHSTRRRCCNPVQGTAGG
jgi:transcriptional regulator with XRE-family HTH domain